MKTNMINLHFDTVVTVHALSFTYRYQTYHEWLLQDIKYIKPVINLADPSFSPSLA